MANLESVNIFLSAKTPEEIVGLQILNNAINGIEYHYQTPMKDGDKWIIWFFADVKDWIDPSKTNEETKRFVEGLNK